MKKDNNLLGLNAFFLFLSSVTFFVYLMVRGKNKI